MEKKTKIKECEECKKKDLQINQLSETMTKLNNRLLIIRSQADVSFC